MIREIWHRKRYMTAAEFVGSKERVLDIGCCKPCKTMSDGSFIKILGRGTGLDIKDCEDKSFDFKKGSVENIPFPDETFDAIVATEIFEHISNLKNAKKEIYRVLKKDGVFVFSSFSGSFFAQTVWFFFTNIAGSSFKEDHINIHTKKEWKKLFEDLFEVEKEKTIWGLTDIIKFRKKTGTKIKPVF